MKTRNLQFWVSCRHELELNYDKIFIKHDFAEILFILSFRIMSIQYLHKKPLLFEELLVQHCSMVIPHIGLQQDLKRFFVNRYLEKR